MPYEIPPLREIGEAIEAENFPFEYLPADADRPVDVLLVSLGDEETGPLLLEMMFINDLMIQTGVPEEYDDAMILQFLVRFPFQVVDGAEAELALFFMGLNRTLPAGAFGLSEDTGTVYHQYALHLPTRAAEKEVLASVVLSLDTFIGGYLGEIRAVAKGESTHQAAFERIRANGFEIPPMLPGPASILGGGAEQ